MPNQYVNKVHLADGTILIDLSSDTAQASDVAAGKYFHLPTGERVAGTGSGGGITTVTILPEQSITASTQDTSGYTVYLDDITENLIPGENYIVTIDGVAYTCHAETAWGSVYAGDVEVIWGTPSNALYPFLLGSYANNRTEWGYGDNNAHTVKIERVVSFSAPELISKSITANGTYDPADDNADGYSDVIVNVSGGASNIVTGTFKGTTTGAAMDVTLNYSGSGYPVAVLIYPDEGAYNSSGSFYSLVKRYVFQNYVIVKNNLSSVPDYTNNTSNNQACYLVTYKNSTSSATTYTSAQSAGVRYYNNISATGARDAAIKLKSSTKMSVYIAGSSYGFAANIDYKYWVLYSS